MLYCKCSSLFSQFATVCLRVGICWFPGTAISYHYLLLSHCQPPPVPIPTHLHPSAILKLKCFCWVAIPPEYSNLLLELRRLHCNVCHDALFSVCLPVPSHCIHHHTFCNIFFSKGWKVKFQVSWQAPSLVLILAFRKQGFQNKYSSK